MSLERSSRQGVAEAVCIEADPTITSNHEPAGDSKVYDVKKFIHDGIRYAFALVLCLTTLAVFVPLKPLMPLSGIDMSWMFAMNQAVAQGMVFGKGMVFTFGPYASIFTKLYHPATDSLMLWGSLYLGLSYALLLLLLGKGKKFYGLLLYGIFLAGFLNSRDTLFFTYPLILAQVIYRMTLPDEHAMKIVLTKPLESSLIFLIAPLGLLPLIKGSLLPLCGAIAVLCFALFWLRGHKALAYLAISVPAFSCILLWRLSGQPISALLGFFLGSWQIISGYSEAMGQTGNWQECVLYLLGAALIVQWVASKARSPKSSAWFLSISYALFLFTAFKAGFVRHDPWHTIIPASSILAAALLLVFVLGEKHALVPLAAALLVWTYIGQRTLQSVTADAALNLQDTFKQAYQGAQIRLSSRGELQKQYDEHIARIRAKFPIPRMSGTSDLYSINQSWLLASGNTWAPRPVPQSYSAYTPELAELDLRHLQGPDAPDNILFSVDPIDGRLPSLEDGLSWPALIDDYSFQRLSSQGAYLHKKEPNHKSALAMEQDFYSARHKFGQEVSLPDTNDPLFATMEITPSLLGKVLGVVYKPPELFISMRLRDGRQMRYRIISSMLKTKFLITPLVENTEQFVLLKAAGNEYLIGDQVKSVTVTSEDGRALFWNQTYSLRLHKSDLTKNTEAENSLLFDKIGPNVAGNIRNPSTVVCEGVIQTVNGKPVRSGIATVGNALSVNGWMVVSGKDGIIPDHVFVTLTDEGGKVIYIKAHSTPQNDVKQHFNHPEMADLGYAAMVDVSSLSGRYTLGLARTYQGNLGICQQFKFPFLIAR